MRSRDKRIGVFRPDLVKRRRALKRRREDIYLDSTSREIATIGGLIYMLLEYKNIVCICALLQQLVF